MAETINGSLQLLHAFNPISPIISPNLNPENSLHLESFFMERGPRYGAYAQLRESKLRMKNNDPQFTEYKTDEPDRRLPVPPPAKKQVRFQGSPAPPPRKGSSILAQSVPDFSAALRKENRRPISRLPSTMETTPPQAAAKIWGKTSGSNLRGSKSSSAAEKRGGYGGARKSYANIDDLKGATSAAARAINGENRVAGRRTVLGSYRPI